MSTAGRHALLVMVALAIALASSTTAAAAQGDDRRPPRRCGEQTRLVHGSTDAPGSTPVVLVHGFKGSPHDFVKNIDDGPTLRPTLTALPGVALYQFDYSERSDQWVVDPAIGPSLARAIVCLRQGSGRRVVVIAHSMGGLATRFAQGQVVDGAPVADSIARVITIGTPNEGVILLALANGTVSNLIVRGAAEVADQTCEKPPRKPNRDLCELLAAVSIPAVKAMDPGSKRLAALPAWNKDLAVDGIAADLRLRISILGVGTTESLGDIVVTAESATANANPASRKFVVTCSTEITDLVRVVDDSHCSHANELSNRRIIKHVVAQVQQAQRRR